VDTQKPAARRIDLVVPADFTRSARRFIVIIDTSRQESTFASLARVSDKRGAKTRQPHLAVGLENRPHHKTLEIKQTHIFIAVATKDDRACSSVEHALRLDRGGETIDRRFVYRVTEDIDRVSVFIEPLHDAHRSAIDRRTEETRDRRIALILD